MSAGKFLLILVSMAQIFSPPLFAKQPKQPSCPSRIKVETNSVPFAVAASLVTGKTLNLGGNRKCLAEINMLIAFLLEGSRNLPYRNLEDLASVAYYPLRTFSRAQIAKAKRLAREQHPSLALIKLPRTGISSVDHGQDFLKDMLQRHFPPGTENLEFTYPTKKKR